MKVLAKTKIKREKGKLYFLKANSEGNLLICCSEMSRKGRPKKNAPKK